MTLVILGPSLKCRRHNNKGRWHKSRSTELYSDIDIVNIPRL
ncbi:rCG63351 [Rattus norvegicus]|uniref:RCG63351 n=1 Tax=Rattus norvegicus TaxID=10116 RepID=A6J793_RAT|nr:rCG63351 [Rattus norvegicus]